MDWNKYADMFSKTPSFSKFKSKPTKTESSKRESEEAAEKYSQYFRHGKKKETTDEMLERLLKESKDRNSRFLEARLMDYVDHCFGLMVLNSKLNNLMQKQREVMFGIDGFELETDIDDEDDAFSTLLGQTRRGFKAKAKPRRKKTTCAPKQKTLQSHFKLYDQYKDGTEEIKLDDGEFNVQIDVGGCPISEILIDSTENHLTVKSRDAVGQKHIFGIVCPRVEDIDKLYIHYPANGLLLIDGPDFISDNGQSESTKKKTTAGTSTTTRSKKTTNASSSSATRTRSSKKK